VVTSFNAFQFAGDITTALREARRGAIPQGCGAMAVWGRDEDCETVSFLDAMSELLPLAPSADNGTPLST
jgi:hypothetical protein